MPSCSAKAQTRAELNLSIVRVVVVLLLTLAAVCMMPARAATLSGLDAGRGIGFAQDAAAFEDASGRLTVGEAADSKRFAPASRLAVPSEGNAPHVYWFRLRLERGGSTAAWALRSSYKVTRIDVYVPSRGGFTHVKSGFDLGAEDDALVPFTLLLPEPALDGKPFYVRVASVVDPRTITLVPLPQAVTTSLQRRVVFGFFVGFFIAIGAFNLLMFLSLRERALLNFAGVMALDACRLIVSFGVLWQVLPQITFLQRELIYDSVAYADQLALALFSIAFLKTVTRDRSATLIVAAGVFVQLSIFITDFFPSAAVAFDWTLVVTLALYGVLIYAGVRAYLRGMRVARIYTAGIGCMAAGFIVNMSSYALPHQELWVYALDTGAALQAILLGLAVAESVQESRAEHEQLLLTSRHLEDLAMRDGLTNVLNRRAFDAALEAAGAVAVAEMSAIGILMVDIDHFKEYNDTLGHRAGDDALRDVARVCCACVREGDTFARYGGEEFGAILAGATLDDVRAVGDRMRTAVQALGLVRRNGDPLTISVGGASGVARSREGVLDLVHQADANLYAAKARGRDRVYL